MTSPRLTRTELGRPSWRRCLLTVVALTVLVAVSMMLLLLGLLLALLGGWLAAGAPAPQ